MTRRGLTGSRVESPARGRPGEQTILGSGGRLRSTGRGIPQPTELCLFGAPLDTGNLGVSALAAASLASLQARLPGASVCLFGNQPGVRHRELRVGGELLDLAISERGAWISRHVHRRESLLAMWLSSRTTPRLNANVSMIDGADCVLDISGGDSFSDIYGARRFLRVSLPKQIAMRRDRPLILLPQTYGPFRSPWTRRIAVRLISYARQTWARDPRSHERLRELMGVDFDPERMRLGTDVAFSLPPSRPRVALGRVHEWLSDDEPTVGVNVSGLLASAARPADRFGIHLDYEEVMLRLARRLVREGVRVVLIPHVRGGWETDELACQRLRERVAVPERVVSLSGVDLDASSTKWIIGRLDWFVGARMHATIAALSSTVPVAAVAYSDKFQGVFASCGLPDGVLDARELSSAELLAGLEDSWSRRSTACSALRKAVPDVITAAERQFDHIVAAIRSDRTAGIVGP